MSLQLLIANRKSLIVKIIAISLVLVAFPTISPLITSHFSLLKAQTTIDAAKENYSIQLTRYNDTKESYITAKSNYIAFKSATSKSEAFLKTKDYLISVDELLLTYIELVRSFGNSTKWQSSSFNKENIDNILDQESSIIKDLKNKVNQTTTLEESIPVSRELKNQLGNSTSPKINKIIVTFDIAQTESTFAKFNQLSVYLNEFVKSRIKPQNQAILANWQSETVDIQEKTQKNLDLAKESYQKIRDDRNNQFQIQQTSKINTLAKDELKRSKNLFEEMLKII